MIEYYLVKNFYEMLNYIHYWGIEEILVHPVTQVQLEIREQRVQSEILVHPVAQELLDLQAQQV
jgi:hypothetical protein